MGYIARVIMRELNLAYSYNPDVDIATQVAGFCEREFAILKEVKSDIEFVIEVDYEEYTVWFDHSFYAVKGRL